MSRLKDLDVAFNASKKVFLDKYENENEVTMFNGYFAREIIILNTLLIENPDLQTCTNGSLRMVLQNIVATGLSLAPALKQSYVIKRGNEAFLEISYMGLIQLLTDSGSVSSVEAHPVYKNDVFEYEIGLKRHLRHVPALENRGKLIAVYAVAHIRGAEPQLELLTADDIQAIKDAPKSNVSTSPAWKYFESEMWRKSAVKRMFKYVNKTKISDELLAALSIEHINDSHLTQGIEINKTQRKEIFATAKEITPETKVKKETKVKAVTPVDEEKKHTKLRVKKGNRKVKENAPPKAGKMVTIKTVKPKKPKIEIKRPKQDFSGNASIFAVGNDLNGLLNKFNT